MNIVILFCLLIVCAFVLNTLLGNNASESAAEELPGTAEDYYADALKSFNEKQYRFAEKSYKLALIQAKKHNKDPKLIAKIVLGLASTFAEQGRFPDAEAMFSESRRMMEIEFGISDLRIATLNSQQARMYARQMRYCEAESLLQETLSMEEETLGSEHKDVIKTVTSLGDLYFEQEKWEEAEPHYRRAMTRHIANSYSPKNQALLDILKNLSVVYRKTGREFEAHELDMKLKDLKPDLQPV